MSDPFDSLSAALEATPELQSAPGVALPLANVPGDTTMYAQALAQGQRQQNLMAAVDDHAAKVGGHSWLGKTLSFFGRDIVHPVAAVAGDVVSPVLHAAGAPLREIQHQYRYLHDVWERHGVADALLEGLGAATVGAAIDIGTGGFGVTAGEAAMGGMARFIHQDSWDRTSNGETYLDKSGKHVSFGRDLAHLSHLQTTQNGVISGVFDAIGDLSLDPLAKLGHMVGEARGAEGLSGLLGRRWSGLGYKNVDNAFQNYPTFRRAVSTMAGMEKEGDIVRAFGQNVAPFAGRIAKANTTDGVLQVFREAADNSQTISGMLPTRSVLRAPFSAMADALKDPSGNAVQRLMAKSARMQNVFNPDTLAFSNKSFALTEQGIRNSSKGIYDSLLMGMRPQAAADIVTELYRTADIGRQQEILRGAWMKMFDNMGLNKLKMADGTFVDLSDASDELVRKRLFHGIEEVTGGNQMGKAGGPAFARDVTGRNTSGFPNPDGSISNVPVHVGDVAEDGSLIHTKDVPLSAFPDFQAARKELAGLSRMKSWMGGADDFFYNNYISKVFKPLALNTLGFAMRVASGEILPQAMKGKAMDFFRSRVATRLAEQGIRLGEDDSPHFIAAWMKAARRPLEKISATAAGQEAADQAELIAHNIHFLGGETINPALAAGHHYSGMVDDGLRSDQAVQQTLRNVPDPFHAGDPVGEFTGRDYNEVYQWQKNLADHAADGPTRAAAQALHNSRPADVDAYIHDVATKAADTAGETAVRKALKDVERGTTAAGPIAVKERPPALETTALREARKAARDVAERELGVGQVAATQPGAVTQQGLPGIEAPTVAKKLPALSEEDQALVERARRAAYDAAKKHLQAKVEEGTLDVGKQQAQAAAKAWLDKAPEALLEGNPRHVTSNIEGMSPHDAWAKHIVDNLVGDVSRPTLKAADQEAAIHTDLLKAVAEGRTPAMSDLADRPTTDRPLKLVGEANKLPVQRGTIEKVANWGHEKVLSPMINYLSREPMYNDLLYQEWKGGLKAAVDSGEMSLQEALQHANTRASFKMSTLVHNLSERTYMSESMRSWAPFLFAQTQSWRRMGQLLVDDPGAFRKFQLASSALSDMGNIQPGSDGHSHMVFPGEGFLANGALSLAKHLGLPAAAAVPVAFTGSVQSLAPVSPLADVQMPNGPLVSFAVHTLTSRFPELAPLGQKLIGEAGMTQSFMDLLIPNTTLRGLYHTFTGDHNQAFMNAQLYVIQDLSRQQQAEDLAAAKEGRTAERIVPAQNASPLEMQQFINKTKNQTRIIMGVRAILASINPTATNAEVGLANLRDEVRTAMKDKGGMALGIQHFLEKHPDATPYTVFTSEANTRAPLAATSEVGQWMNNHIDTVKKYGYGGAWLIPQAKDTFDQGVYNEQLALALRQHKAPEQFFKDIQIASSNNQYYALKDSYDKELQKATQSGDTNLQKSLHRRWGHLTETFGAQNPVWYADFQSPDRSIMRDHTIQDFKAMAQDPNLPPSPQWEGIQRLVNNYDQYVTLSMPGRRDTVAVEQRKVMARRWDAYLDQEKKDHPDLSPLIMRVFKGATPAAEVQAATAKAMSPQLTQLISQLTPQQLAGEKQ